MTGETLLLSDHQPRSTETSKRRALRRRASDQRGTSGNSGWCEVRVGWPQVYLSVPRELCRRTNRREGPISESGTDARQR